MRWGDLDLTAGTWNRKAADLKQGRDHSVPLSPPALTILSALRDEQTANGKRALSEFVVPSAVSTARHLVEVRRLRSNGSLRFTACLQWQSEGLHTGFRLIQQATDLQHVPWS